MLGHRFDFIILGVNFYFNKADTLRRFTFADNEWIILNAYCPQCMKVRLPEGMSDQEHFNDQEREGEALSEGRGPLYPGTLKK